MHEEKKYGNFSLADLERYRKGLMSPGEMHELEKSALDDPFLADALEGYISTDLNIEEDVLELKNKLRQRAERARGPLATWWKVAAAVLIVVGLGLVAAQLLRTGTNKSAEMLDEKKLQPVKRAGSEPNHTITRDSLNKNIAVSPVNTASAVKQKVLRISTGNNDTVRVSNESKKTENFSEQFLANKKPDSARAAGRLVAVPSAAGDVTEERGKKLVTIGNEPDQQHVHNFRGHVTDAYNNPLPFANVTNTKDKVGTYADAHGDFVLLSPDSILVVQVRSVGFENGLAQLQSSAANKVVLKDADDVPNKVVSTGITERNPAPEMRRVVEGPEPADGWTNYNIYLVNNVKIPEPIDRGKGNQVQVSFGVNESGEPTDIKVEKSLGPQYDQEAVRLIREGPKWRSSKGKRVKINVPFNANH